MFRFYFIVVVANACLVQLVARPLAGGDECLPPQSDPQQVAVDARRLNEIDALVGDALDQQRMPGCVVLIGRQGHIVFRKAYGNRRLKPDTEPMTTDIVFDLASLTKPVATATAVMLLFEDGHLKLEDKVVQHLPELEGHDKDKITILQLLTHQSGLPPANPLSHFDGGPQQAWQRIWELELSAPPGSRFIYSDVGYLVLGKLVERLSGMPLDEFCRRRLFEPLGMKQTGFVPDEALRARAAPTEQRDGDWIQGEVHDPRAHRLGGVAGHAGLFSTADDLARYAQMMLDRGRCGERQIMAGETWSTMVRPREVPGGLRALGWDVRSGYSSNRGENFSGQAFGHGGFTGTVLWIDPQLQLFVIFLSNRVHPDGSGSVNRLAGRIGTAAAAAIEP